SMIAKNCEGKVPEPGALTAEDEALLDKFAALLQASRQHMDRQAIHLMLEALWRLISDCNKYFAGEEPWALKKTDPARMNTVLYVTAEAIRGLAILAQPIMPGASARMLDQLAVAEDGRSFAHMGARDKLQPGTALPAPEGVFPRFQED
ncbi:MAG: class I tRNA ligase family protein, partial [Proteobacteria bacterium]|nr:class I tRNA ligase family protein [Pseudomonadota bacterium]